MATKARKKETPRKKVAPVHLPHASAARQRAVMRDLNKVLAAHGVTGKVAELHLIGVSVTDGCPPGQTKRVVCRKQSDGSVICTEECA